MALFLHISSNGVQTFMPISFWDHPIETIERALRIRKRIEALQGRLNEILGGDAQLPLPYFIGKRSAAAKARKARENAAAKAEEATRIVSKASRKRMAAAHKARWAKQKRFPHTGAGIE
jgi:hypothetical protein